MRWGAGFGLPRSSGWSGFVSAFGSSAFFKTCHRCGQLGHRDALLFSCPTCGFEGDADCNAALNIAARGVQVTAPELVGLQAQ
jgi:hypothetical protein